MGFDASKVRDEVRVLDRDAASLDRWIPDAAASVVGVNAAAVRRGEGFAVARYRSKNRLNTPNPWIVPPQKFAVVRAGCRQTVVNCRRACAVWVSVLLVYLAYRS
jgi:hypothetical protein